MGLSVDGQDQHEVEVGGTSLARSPREALDLDPVQFINEVEQEGGRVLVRVVYFIISRIFTNG
jgi:hypothetical protein